MTEDDKEIAKAVAVAGVGVSNWPLRERPEPFPRASSSDWAPGLALSRPMHLPLVQKAQSIRRYEFDSLVNLLARCPHRRLTRPVAAAPRPASATASPRLERISKGIVDSRSIQATLP